MYLNDTISGFRVDVSHRKSDEWCSLKGAYYD